MLTLYFSTIGFVGPVCLLIIILFSINGIVGPACLCPRIHKEIHPWAAPLRKLYSLQTFMLPGQDGQVLKLQMEDGKNRIFRYPRPSCKWKLALTSFADPWYKFQRCGSSGGCLAHLPSYKLTTPATCTRPSLQTLVHGS